MTVEFFFMINLHESIGLGLDQTQEHGSAIRLAIDCAIGPLSI